MGMGMWKTELVTTGFPPKQQFLKQDSGVPYEAPRSSEVYDYDNA